MLGNDRMETVSTAVTLIQRRSDKENSNWRTSQYFVDFESQISVETSTANRCHNFHENLLSKIDEIFMSFPGGFSTSNSWRIDKYVSIWRE